MSKFYIEEFPTSPAAIKMLRRVSPIYGDSYVAKWLYQVMGIEWDEVEEIIGSLRDQVFTQRVTWGIEYQEYKYSIVPDNSLTLEERRARLYRKRTKKYPLNPKMVEKYLHDGWGFNVEVDETRASGYIYINVPHDMPKRFMAMLADLRNLKPSHLVLKFEIPRNGVSKIWYGFVTGRVGEMALLPNLTILEDPDAFTGKVGMFRAGRSHVGME